MRRIVLSAVALMLTMPGVAVAKLPYKTGQYFAGSATKVGVSVKVTKGRFSVDRIAFNETCANAQRSFTELGGFQAGDEATLAGKVKSDGTFSGKYSVKEGYVKASGLLKGSKMTVTGTSRNTYKPNPTEAEFLCLGKGTFTAKPLQISTR